MDVLTAIQRRVSVRSYEDRSVKPALLERLLGLARTADHLSQVPPRIELISGVERTRRVLTYIIGSYGLVRNPPHLLAAVMPEESDVARLDLGYVLEQVVLEATRLGLGTCWITGSYDAQRAGDAVGLAPGEVAAAVCALGYPPKDLWGRFHDRAMHRWTGGYRRKPLAEIVFSERWGEPWSPNGTDPTLAAALEHARLGPLDPEPPAVALHHQARPRGSRAGTTRVHSRRRHRDGPPCAGLRCAGVHGAMGSTVRRCRPG